MMTTAAPPSAPPPPLLSSPSPSPTRPPPAAPLTTIWIPPCGIDNWGIGAPESCNPPNFNAYLTTSATTMGYYSPGICPEGFNPLYRRFDTLQGPGLLEGETARLCVQYGYTSDSSLKNFYAISVSGRVTSVRPYIQVRWQESDLDRFQTPPRVIVDGKTSTVLAGETTSAGKPSLSYGAASAGMATETGTSSGTVTSTGWTPDAQGTSGLTKHPVGSSPTSSGAHNTLGGSKVEPTLTTTNSRSLTPRVKGAIASSVIVAVLFACIAAVLFLRRYRAKQVVSQQPTVEEGQRVFELDAENTPASPLEKDQDNTRIDTKPHTTKDNDSATILDAQDRSPETKPAPSPDSQPLTTLPSQTPLSPSSSRADEAPSPLPPPKLPTTTTTATGYSAMPSLASSPDADETALDGLRARQASLELERQRLLRLQEIEAEQERLRAQMAVFGCRSQRPSSVI